MLLYLYTCNFHHHSESDFYQYNHFLMELFKSLSYVIYGMNVLMKTSKEFIQLMFMSKSMIIHHLLEDMINLGQLLV